MGRWLAGIPGLLLAGAAAAAPVAVSDAWIRWLPGELPVAGYFVLSNRGELPLRLTGAHSAAFGKVTLHRTLHEDGGARMVPVAEVEVAPRDSVRFAPGGYHLMMMKRREALAPGARVPVTLELGEAGAVEAEFAVRGARGE